MNGLIKANNIKLQSKVRYLDATQNRPHKHSDDSVEFDERDNQIMQLTKQVEYLNSQIENIKKTEELKIRVAQEEAVIQAKKDAISDEKSRIELLESNLKLASLNLTNNISELEKLSLAISHTTLSKILGEKHNYQSFMAENIKNNIRKISGKTIIRIAVSSDDFSDENSLSVLAKNCDNLEFTVDKNLQAGGCKIQLLLGHIDISIDKQWFAISKTFEELAIL